MIKKLFNKIIDIFTKEKRTIVNENTTFSDLKKGDYVYLIVRKHLSFIDNTIYSRDDRLNRIKGFGDMFYAYYPLKIKCIYLHERQCFFELKLENLATFVINSSYFHQNYAKRDRSGLHYGIEFFFFTNKKTALNKLKELHKEAKIQFKLEIENEEIHYGKIPQTIMNLLIKSFREGYIHMMNEIIYTRFYV